MTIRNRKRDIATDTEEVVGLVAHHEIHETVFQPIRKPKGNTFLGNYHLAKLTQVEIGSIFK